VAQVSPTRYLVTGRVNSAGTLVFSLPEGVVTTANGAVQPASTSKDNSVTFISPYTVKPAELHVAEGSDKPGVFEVSAAAGAAPITVTPTPDKTGVLDLRPASADASPQGPATFEVTAPNDHEYLPGRVITLTLAATLVTSPGTSASELDGLRPPNVIVHIDEASKPPAVSVDKRAWVDVSAGKGATYEQILADVKAREVPAGGPPLPPGTRVWWTYEVRNAGGGTLRDLVVRDDQVGEICRVASLAEGAAPQGCAASGVVE
jgi:hypothetical protein